MNKLLLLMLLFLIPVIVAAQDPKPVAPTSVQQPTAQQKQALKEAAETYRQAQSAADQARDKFTIQLLNTLAELGLKPSETKLDWDQSGLPTFSKISPAPANAAASVKQDVKKNEDKKNP